MCFRTFCCCTFALSLCAFLCCVKQLWGCEGFQGLNEEVLKIQVSLSSQHLSKSMCDRAAEELFQYLLTVGETCCPAQQWGGYYGADYNDTEHRHFLDQSHSTAICPLLRVLHGQPVIGAFVCACACVCVGCNSRH